MSSAYRVEEDDVLEIYTPDDESIVLEPCIAAAHAIVEDKLTDSAVGHGETLLTEIERWLAAHFVAIVERLPNEEKLGPAEVRFGNKLGMGLDNTIYGQQAKLLDTSGTLARLNNADGSAGGGGGQARFRVINPAWDGT